MIIFVFLLLISFFIPCRIHGKDFHTGYLSRETTTAVKGALCFFILISHFTQNEFYPFNSLDSAFMTFRNFYSQFPMVVVFIYSSYGIMEAIRVKGFSYIEKIPLRRIGKTFIIYAAAQIVFLIFNFLTGRSYSISDIILAFTGWRTIGADNWFIFAIFVLYAITWAAFRMYRENYCKASAVVTVGTVFLIFAFIRLNKDPYWYNTLLAFPLGFWYSLFREKIESFLFCNRRYYPVLFLVVGLFAVIWVGICKMSSDCSVFLYEICSCLWATAVVLLTMKIDVANPVLRFCGKNLFGFYMMHRIVLMLLPQTGYLMFPWIRFIVFCLLSAPLAWGFTYLSEKLASFVLKKLKA